MRGENNLDVLKVLDAMHTYFVNSDNNFHVGVSLAYCPACEAVTPYVGDYKRSTGNDCLGEHFEIVKAPQQCGECLSTNFLKVSKEDFSDLNNKYRDRTAEILIEGIKNGLKVMSYPSLYNEELPEIADKWRQLDKQEKINQINQLLSIQDKLLVARKGVEELEQALAV